MAMIVKISLFCFCLTLARAGTFEYEHLLNKAVFPPIIEDGKPTEELPGHKKPLGYQRPPEGPVKEYTDALNAKDFWRLHGKPHVPLVLRGYIKESPAIKNWKDDEYLAKHYGDLDVLVEHKSEDRTSSSGRMVIKDFLKNYKDQDMYVVTMFPSEMMHEVKAIPTILCGTFKNYTHESNLWLSNGGTRSVVHYDADHNFHCMIDGRKDFIMINNNMTTKTNLYFKYKDPGVGSGFSFLDPDTIDMNKFKKIAKVPWTYATLYPGDCIFIPSVYIHQVRGYGRTVAVTTLFTADVSNNFQGDDCTDDIMKDYHSMAEINFQWTYKKGDPTIDMGYMNVKHVQKRVYDALRDKSLTKNGKFTKKQFIMFSGLFSAFGRKKEKMAQIWNDVFGYKDDYIFDKSSMRKLSLEQWKAYCRAVEAPHGVVTNGTEGVFVKPGERHKWETANEEEDDGDDVYMTEEEKRIQSITNQDPMLRHLSKEEQEEYIKNKKEQKKKYGVDYDLSSEVTKVSWEADLGWKMEDIPEKYRNDIQEGRIPVEFKEEFVTNLPEVLTKEYTEDLAKNIVPEPLRKLLVAGEDDTYREKIRKKMNTDDEDDDDFKEEDDNQEDENEEDDASEIPIKFEDLGKTRQKLLLQGRISSADAKEIVKGLPERWGKFRNEIEKGLIPDELLMELLRSDEENFKTDRQNWMKQLKMKVEKDEL